VFAFQVAFLTVTNGYNPKKDVVNKFSSLARRIMRARAPAKKPVGCAFFIENLNHNKIGDHYWSDVALKLRLPNN
jgi:hypothetical protein